MAQHDQPDHDEKCNLLIGVISAKTPKPPVQKSPVIGTMFLSGLCGSNLPRVSTAGRGYMITEGA
jgi:hypothetical protein